MHANDKGDGTGAQLPRDPGEDTNSNGERMGDPVITLDESAQQMIGQQLKAVYDEIVQQPVPDQFLKLLDELERKERGQ
jgi:hypothetical protein